MTTIETKDNNHGFRDSTIFIVYKKAYASRLVLRGHQILYTFPNPKNKKMTAWAFVNDGTIADDLLAIQQEG